MRNSSTNESGTNGVRIKGKGWKIYFEFFAVVASLISQWKNNFIDLSSGKNLNIFQIGDRFIARGLRSGNAGW